MRMRFLLITVLMAMATVSCHRKHLPASSAEVSGSQTGLASFYAESYNGRKTANGEIFHSSDMTAAHKTLPFGTKVRVTNLSNGKSVKVRINDRGPYVAGRIIDLTRAAAKKIDMVQAGVVKVRIRY
ncbi:MAG: septal ring lytic transglycosylase RlpA family protein [Bacteroidota bacterium]|nr:septal ring lytic transglycosylase RlpA family protein [Bacteroidota bacterium]